MNTLIKTGVVALLATSRAQPLASRAEVTRPGTPARETYDVVSKNPTTEDLNRMQIACFGGEGIKKVCCTRFDQTGERFPHTPIDATSITPGSYCMPEDGVHMRPLASQEAIVALSEKDALSKNSLLKEEL